MPRSRLGPLAIESKLGDHPSTSTVWRAVHVAHRKAVAVKVFSAPFGGTPEARKEFADEWERLKTIRHPGVAKCFGGGFEETDAYLAFELIEGETLARQLERSGRLSWENVLDLAQGLIEAIEALHQLGIVHGAITPDKVIVSGFAPVLLDVRCNRETSPFRSSRTPSAEEVARRAPELTSGSSPPTVQSELYAFGAMLYQAITGRLPITGESVEAVRDSVASQVPPSPASIVLQCPVWFDKLIMSLLEKDPALRPINATAVKLALAEVRKRVHSRTGVAEHVSQGFSPLQVTDQSAKDEARELLGRGVVDLEAADERERRRDSGVVIAWHDQPWLLILGFVVILGFLTYIAWPASENSLRSRAEKLIGRDTRVALAEARDKPLRQLLNQFPEGEHAGWAREQVDEINVRLFLDQLSIKLKNNAVLEDQGELLHRQAQELVDDGDWLGGIEKYDSMITVLGEDPDYRIAVNAAKKQRDLLREKAEADRSAEQLVRSRLEQADKLFREGRQAEARSMWQGLLSLYGSNASVASLLQEAQDRLDQESGALTE